MEPSYVYRCLPTRIIDGDTFVADVDLGFATEHGKPGIRVPLRIRIRGINAPELSQSGGPLAREALRQLIEHDAGCVIQTHKDERSFERWIADVWTSDGLDVAEAMVRNGRAERRV